MMGTIGALLGKGAALVATHVAKAGVDYASEAFAGHVGIKVLTNMVSEAAATGASVAGRLGEMAGNFFGRAIAGHSLPEVSSKVKWIGETLRSAGNAAIDALTAKDEEKPAPADAEAGAEAKAPEANSKYLDAAVQVGKIAATIAGGVALASGIVPMAGVGLMYAAADAVPKIIKAALEVPSDKVDLVDDVIVDVAKKFAVEGISQVIGNVVRFDTVKNAYDARVAEGVKTGNWVGSYLPKCMQGVAEKVGRFAGTVDAGRFAMSDEVIKKANTAADTAEQFVKGGLGLADAVVTKGFNTEAPTLYDKARKVAVIAAGVAGGAALCALAPQAAPIIAGTALLSVSDKIVSWAKGKICGALPQEVVAKKEIDKPVTLLQPTLALNESLINSEYAAPAA